MTLGGTILAVACVLAGVAIARLILAASVIAIEVIGAIREWWQG